MAERPHPDPVTLLSAEHPPTPRPGRAMRVTPVPLTPHLWNAIGLVSGELGDDERAIAAADELGELLRYREALAWCVREWLNGGYAGDIDGGAFQDEMEARGVLVRVPASREYREEWDVDTMLVARWSPLAQPETTEES
jgi:hypothetical protein